ncbi:coiled-coil domain-containing protein [Lewinella sp. IMCC34191]|uniref:coiled-coil domain-containing protein n=1 Tax=Lewinella sp. IMCC34191 TaxID=2259172 RepID=UPI0013001F9D|nr:hypothetical protein [Lewinella sp. IMCC34191]
MRVLHYSVFLFCLLGFSTVVAAQVASRQLAMSKGNNEALILDLPTADADDVEDLWEDWLKDTYGVKTSKTRKVRTGELSSLNFELPGIGSGNKVDLYSMIREMGEGSELTVWIATPQGYVGPDLNTAQYNEAEKMLMRFALEVSRYQMEEDVDAQEDLLSDLEKELDRLKRDKERAEKDIEDVRERIAKLEAEIAANLVDQESKQAAIQDQIQVVEEAKLRLKKF